MLQLGHVLFGGRFFRKRPRQHELGLEHRPGALDHPVDGCRHPAFDRMEDLPLHLGDDLAGIALVPVPIEVLGDHPELDDQIAGQVLRFDLAALFAPKPEQGGLVVAHDDPGVRAADEGAAVTRGFASISNPWLTPSPTPLSVRKVSAMNFIRME